jgi:enamine deaminase RidA (YjgF/YER057c/UK114 family)
MTKRKSIHIEGMEHGAPIPNGTVIGNMIFSSAISGKDAKTGVLSPEPDEQAEAMFRNLRLFMDKAGGTPDNIAHMTVFLKEEKYRDSVMAKDVSRWTRSPRASRADCGAARAASVSDRGDRGSLTFSF